MRRKAIESLTGRGNLRGLKLLIASLGDQDRGVRCAAAEAIATITEELSAAARVAALATGDGHVAAAPAFQHRGRIQSEPKAARVSAAGVRRAAFSGSGRDSSQLESSNLLQDLGDPDVRVRLAAAQALEPLADPGHLTHFLTLLADENFEVRIMAIRCLRRLGDPVVVPALLARLADSDSDVRIATAQALGAIGNPTALEPLVLSLTDEEPAVRQAVAAALEQIDPRWVRTDAAQRAMPRLELLLKDSRPWIAAAAQKVLDKLRDAKDKDTAVWKRESGIRRL
jgi:HEAT repeat protein